MSNFKSIVIFPNIGARVRNSRAQQQTPTTISRHRLASSAQALKASKAAKQSLVTVHIKIHNIAYIRILSYGRHSSPEVTRRFKWPDGVALSRHRTVDEAGNWMGDLFLPKNRTQCTGDAPKYFGASNLELFSRKPITDLDSTCPKSLSQTVHFKYLSRWSL